MTTRSQQRDRRRWLPVFLAALVAVLAVLGLAGTASAATPGVAETRIRASTAAGDILVGPPERIDAGQRLVQRVVSD